MTLEQAVERLAAQGQFFLGIDFDGTLAPIVDHPDMAEPDPTALEILRDLSAREAVEVAVVSGRGLTDLQERLGAVPGATLVGEHGNDIGEHSNHDPLIGEATEMIRELAAEAGGLTVETKTSSVTFHYRGLDDEDAERYLRRIRDWAALRTEIHVMEGKKVIELSTATRSKGDAIRDLAGERPVIYIGDDTTDESVFEVLGDHDIGVKVGEGPTAARYRLKDVPEVVTILEKIALASR